MGVEGGGDGEIISHVSQNLGPELYGQFRLSRSLGVLGS